MGGWFWAYVVSGWVLGLVLVPVVARRCAPAKAWGWLAIMFAAPWIGFGLYLLFGENPLGRKRVIGYRQVIRSSGAGKALSHLAEFSPGDCVSGAAAGLERLARAGGALPAVGGNEGTFLGAQGPVLPHLIEDIDASAHHVHMSYYIFRDDETGRAVADALIRAAQRGVACRALADAVGSYPMFRTLGPRLREGGVDVRPSLPINPLRRRLARIDLRNHRKITVIDGRVAYVGSWNIADRDYGRGSDSNYHELLVRLCGPAVLQVQLLFLEDWHFESGEALHGDETFPAPSRAGGAAVQAIPSGPMYPSAPVRDLAISAIHLARERAVLTTPYFVPDEALMLSLRLAVRRGVRVDIVVPTRSDHSFVDAAGRSYLRTLLAGGAHVHFHRPGILHAKTMTVDGTFGMIGSANFDVRSFRLDVEANLAVYSPDLLAGLVACQEHYIEQSEPGRHVLRRRSSRLSRLGEDLVRLISPLI